MCAVSIGKYEYVYGAGNTPNRSIQFFGDGHKIWGEVEGKLQGSWQKIGSIDEAHMTLEGASTTKKMEIMMMARQNFTNPIYPSDKSLDQISYTEKLNVIKNLQPTGRFRIEIINNIGNNPTFEKVESITFFDPS